MRVRIDDKSAEKIEQLASSAEMFLEEDELRRDLKERRGIMKQTLYDGSKKLKHVVPKGKQC